MAKKKESDNIDDDDIARAAKKWFGKAKKRVKKEIEEYQEDKEKERQEKLEKKKQDYIKEVEKKSKRKKAAKKGVQTRRKNTAANLQSELNDIKFWQGTIHDVLQGIQEELDELLDKNGINPLTAVFAVSVRFISLGVSATVPVLAFAVLIS